MLFINYFHTWTSLRIKSGELHKDTLHSCYFITAVCFKYTPTTGNTPCGISESCMDAWIHLGDNAHAMNALNYYLHYSHTDAMRHHMHYSSRPTGLRPANVQWFVFSHASQMGDVQKSSGLHCMCENSYWLPAGFETLLTVYRCGYGFIKEKLNQVHTTSCKQRNIEVFSTLNLNSFSRLIFWL